MFVFLFNFVACFDSKVSENDATNSNFTANETKPLENFTFFANTSELSNNTSINHRINTSLAVNVTKIEKGHNNSNSFEFNNKTVAKNETTGLLGQNMNISDSKINVTQKEKITHNQNLTKSHTNAPDESLSLGLTRINSTNTTTKKENFIVQKNQNLITRSSTNISRSNNTIISENVSLNKTAESDKIVKILEPNKVNNNETIGNDTNTHTQNITDHKIAQNATKIITKSQNTTDNKIEQHTNNISTNVTRPQIVKVSQTQNQTNPENNQTLPLITKILHNNTQIQSNFSATNLNNTKTNISISNQTTKEPIGNSLNTTDNNLIPPKENTTNATSNIIHKEIKSIEDSNTTQIPTKDAEYIINQTIDSQNITNTDFNITQNDDIVNQTNVNTTELLNKTSIQSKETNNTEIIKIINNTEINSTETDHKQENTTIIQSDVNNQSTSITESTSFENSTIEPIGASASPEIPIPTPKPTEIPERTPIPTELPSPTELPVPTPHPTDLPRTPCPTDFPIPTPHPTDLPIVREKCGGNNTHFEVDRCVCNDGFMGRPISGCYKCETACDEYAECVGWNRCKCLEGYTGNGFKCTQLPPLVISVSPTECLKDERCLVSVFVKIRGRVPDSAFCKFGNVIVKSEEVDENLITCKAPLFTTTAADIQVSIDAKTWSKEAAQISFISKGIASFGWFWPTLGFLTAFAIIFSLVFMLRSQNDEDRLLEEKVPLKHPQNHKGDFQHAKFRVNV